MNGCSWLRWVLIGCVCAGTAGAGELFQDRALEQGFRLSAVASSMKPVEIANVLCAKPDSRPVWRLAQWGTRFSLDTATVEQHPDGTRTLTNAGKSVAIHPGGLAGDGITLAVNGGAEYGGALRKSGEPWPHLLIEQSMPRDLRPEAFARLGFTVAFRVDYCRNATDATLDPGLHTAHITAFWTLHNGNPDSADFRDMIWFGVPLFDARHPIPPGHQAVDRGKDDATGKFICTLEGRRFFDEATGDGAWHILACDLVPLMEEALAVSQTKGFLTDTQFADLQMSSFNLGWEVPGPYDCSISLRDLRLDGTAL